MLNLEVYLDVALDTMCITKSKNHTLQDAQKAKTFNNEDLINMQS